MSHMNGVGLKIIGRDRPGLLRDVAAEVAASGANIESVQHSGSAEAELSLEVVGLSNPEEMVERIRQIDGVHQVEQSTAVGAIFGKRVIVIGGGAQVAQVVLGAVSEADRHNIRGERISVDTIPLVGEERLVEAVRAVARLPRAQILVLAGSIMGGDVALAVRELREKHHIPVLSLAMIGSVPEEADLVIHDPVQAGVMAVMAIAETAAFDLARVRGRVL